MANENSSADFPQVEPASKFAVLVAPTDFAVYLGITRSRFSNEGMAVSQVVEYSRGFTLSPTTAKQLHAALGQAIDQYEKQFGKINLQPEAITKQELPGATKHA